MIPVLSLLILHGVIGGVDVLVNHELAEKLPHRESARHEEILHSLRELLFALIFGGLALFEWRGSFAWCIVALLAGEFLVSLTDTLLEDKIRRLPPLERALHVLLFINFGAYVALFVPVLADWNAMSSALEPVHYGWRTWLLSGLSALALAWCIRDALASLSLNRISKSTHILRQ
jgi:membrane-bound metal-dependent hydrolase YbcI (DUF457 family)